MGKMDYSERDLVAMALTAWGEARGEPDDGVAAVCWSIRNRAEADLWQDGKPDWWGEGVAGVALKPAQYSCHNAADPNSTRLRAFATGGDAGSGSLTAEGLADPGLQRCLEIARGVLDGSIADPTKGATHYYADTIAAPRWTDGRKPSAHVGHHLFFNDVEGGYRRKRQPATSAGAPPNLAAAAPAVQARAAVEAHIASMETAIAGLRQHLAELPL